MNVVVIIPVHNGERTTRRAIDSVLAQTSGAAVNIVAIDDASTDGSVRVAPRTRSPGAGAPGVA